MFALKLLGGATLQGRAGPVTGRAAHKRRLALLAILAVARGRPVGRERIIGLLWPDNPSDSARHLLSESLYVLRKELGEGALVGVGDEVALDPEGVSSDVGEFEAALEAGDVERAARMYAGPFLDGFYVADAPEFERWAEGERDRLARAWARAVESLAEEREGAGRPLDAADWWRALAARDPHSSRIALRLMRALDAARERAAALRAASTHAALMREDLGVQPDPEVLAFAERLRAEPPRGAAPGIPVLEPPGTPASPGVPEEAPAAPSGDFPAPAPVPAEAVDAVDAVRQPGHPPRVPRRAARPEPRWNRAAYHAGLVGMILGLVLSVLTTPRRPETDPAHRRDPRRIAVLYFRDQTPEGDHGYLVDGLTEGLIRELDQVEGIRIVSAGGVRPFRDHPLPLDSIAARLDVGSLVEGSVQASGDSLQFLVQLTDPATGQSLGSHVIRQRKGELFALQDSLVQQVAGFLRKRLGDEVRLRQKRAGTRSDAAFELVLRAEGLRKDAAFVARAGDRNDLPSASGMLRAADSLLREAEAEDPDWVQPSIDRGWVALDRARNLSRQSRISLGEEAIRHADRALELERGNPFALELRGTALRRLSLWESDDGLARGRMEGAERDLLAAVRIDPTLASAWSTLSRLYLYRGAYAQAEATARHALEEDAYLADADQVLNGLFLSTLMLRKYEDAGRWCARGRNEFPGDYRFLECALTLLRDDASREPDPARAWEIVAELDRIDPPPAARASGRAYSPVYRRMAAAGILARSGQKDSARAVLTRALLDLPAGSTVRLEAAYDEAFVRLLLGERDEAVRLLRSYLRANPSLRSFFTRDPLFRDLAREITSGP